jgi:hypothetical protein
LTSVSHARATRSVPLSSRFSVSLSPALSDPRSGSPPIAFGARAVCVVRFHCTRHDSGIRLLTGLR